MTTTENNLALQIIKENFGEKTRSIASLLISKKSYPLMAIASDLDMDKKMVAQIISVLITHNLIEYKLNSKQIVEYKLNTKNVLDRIKYSRYINIINHSFDENASSLVQELILHGYLEMSSLILKRLISLYTQLDQSEIDQKKLDINFHRIKESFEKLVQKEYIQRLPQLDSLDHQKDVIKNGLSNETRENGNTTNTNGTDQFQKPKVPKFLQNDHSLKEIPQIKIDNARRIKAIQEDNQTVTIKLRRPEEDFGDSNIYWKLNEKKFHQEMRDQHLVDAFENQIDKNAANIMRVILNLSNTKIDSNKAVVQSCVSKPVTAIDIHKMMRVEYNMDSATVDRYLTVMVQDSFKVLERIGDFSGGTYVVDFRKGSYNLCVKHIESYIREKFGSKSLRIFKVILEKMQLEQKQIEDFSMIPAKDCKALLYNMLNDNLFTLTELSKTSDHAPSRTYYLFTVDVFQISKKLLQNTYKTLTNLMLKREHLAIENKRLLEKNIKVNTIVESLMEQGSEQAEIDDVKMMISAEEVKLLNCINDHCNKIELAEIQLVETIFLFENYFYYHTIAPVITNSRKQ